MPITCPFLRPALLAATLLAACQTAQAWDVQAGVSSAQVTRALVYIDRPLAEVTVGWSNEQGWSAGALAARAFDAPQATLAANLGYGWPLADGVDAYVGLGHADYRREGDWRLRYHDARLGVSFHERLFLSVQRLFGVHGRASFGPLSGAGTVTREAVWRQPLPHALTVVAGAGHAAQQGNRGFSYWYGNLGLQAVVSGATLEANWITTSAAARRRWGKQSGNRWVGSVRLDF